MHFNDSMQQLAHRLGLDQLRPDARGEYPLVFDDELVVRCVQVGKSLLLCGSIGKRPANPQEAEDKLKTVLRHSLATMKAQSEIVSLEADGEFILHRTLAPETAQIEHLEQALGDYLNCLEGWRRIFAGMTRPGPALSLLFP